MDDGMAQTDDTTGGESMPTQPNARDVEIVQIVVNQATQVTAWPAGGRNARLFRGRPTLIQALHAVPSSFQARPIRAELHLVFESGQETVLEHTLEIGPDDYERESLRQTLHWIVPGELIEPGLNMWVDLFEVEAPSAEPPQELPRFPSTPTAVGIEAAETELHLVFFPYGDTGGCPEYSPEPTQEELDAIVNRIYATSPVTAVTYEIRPDNPNPGDTFSLGLLWRDEGSPPGSVYLGLEAGCRPDRGSEGGTWSLTRNSDGWVEAAGNLILGPTPEQAAAAAVSVVPHVLGLENMACGDLTLEDCFRFGTCIEPHYGDGNIGVPGFSGEDRQVRPTFIAWDSPCPIGDTYEPRWPSDETYNRVYGVLAGTRRR